MMYSLRKFSILFCLISGFLGIESDNLSQTCEKHGSKCSINFSSYTTERYHEYPLIIKSLDPLDIFDPFSSIENLYLPKDGTLLFKCVGRDNRFISSNEPSARKIIHWPNALNASCACGSLFDFACSIFDASGLKCEQANYGDVRVRDRFEVKSENQYNEEYKYNFRLLEAPVIAGILIPELRILFSETDCLARSVQFDHEYKGLKTSKHDWSPDKIHDGYACRKVDNEHFYRKDIQKCSFHYYDKEFKNSGIQESFTVDDDNYFVPAFLAPSIALSFRFGYMTQLYVNSAPQWNTINKGNWKVTQEFISELTYNKAVFGIHSNLGLNEGKPMNLYNDGHGEKLLPIPLFFVALVDDGGYEGRSNAFITVNNPYANHTTVDDLRKKNCDKSVEAPDFEWDYSKTSEGHYTKGYSFVCSVWDFVYKSGFPYEDTEVYKNSYKSFDLKKKKEDYSKPIESFTHDPSYLR